jgi:type IV secretion system protein VirB3
MQAKEINHNTILSCPIHQSLIRPILLGGAERTLVLLNMTLTVMLIFGAGLQISTMLSAIFLIVFGQGILVRLGKYDANFSQVYLRHIRYKDFYLAHGFINSDLVRRTL